MGGYLWNPQILLQPRDGIAEVIQLNSAFTDAKGPVKIDPDHSPEIQSRQDINRNENPLVYGARRTVVLTIEILSMQDHEVLARIVNALLRRLDFTVSLSLDGVTFFEVTMNRYTGPTPLGGKTFVGARYELGLRAVALTDQIPAIGMGRF